MAESNSTLCKRCSTCLELKPASEFFKASCCKDGLRGECKPCVAAKQRIYNKLNANQISQRKKTVYYADGAEVERKEKRAAYYEENREKIKEASRRVHARNALRISARRKSMRSTLNARAQAWRDNNRDRVRANTNAYYATHKDRMRPSRKAAKAHRRSVGSIEPGFVSRLMAMQQGKCACCSVGIKHKPYHLDHIMPIAKGGDNAKGNLQLLCPPCNLQKNAKHPVDFMQSRGFLL